MMRGEVEERQVTRPDWDEYFLGIARAVAVRGDCTRSQVGAVLVGSDRRVHGTGYNGAPPGGPSCLAGECPRGRLSYDQVEAGSSYDSGAGACIAIHAELNVILYTSPDERLFGTLYVTREPCAGCLRIIQGSGVLRVAWPEGEWRTSPGRPNWVRSHADEMIPTPSEGPRTMTRQEALDCLGFQGEQ